MQDIKQNLADAIRKSRTELGLSQEKLAEILGFDSRTILNIENGRGNPKFEKLYPLVRHLNISADRIFYPESVTPQPNLQKLFIMLNDCTEQEVAELLPAVHYLLAADEKTGQFRTIRKTNRIPFAELLVFFFSQLLHYPLYTSF